MSVVSIKVRILNQGTKRFPIAARLVGRTAQVVGTAAQGRVLKLAVHDRVNPLRVSVNSVRYI